VNRPLILPEELHRNAPEVHARGPENTGSILIDLVAESLGLRDLGASDVLDVGCGVRFTQAIVNRGQVTTADLEILHQKMARSIIHNGGQLAAVYACPHRPDECCYCRKPEPGLLLAAADHLGGGLGDAILVGDHLTDLEAARRAGCRSILVSSGRHYSTNGEVLPDNCLGIVPDLLAAARHMTGPGLIRGSWQMIGPGDDTC